MIATRSSQASWRSAGTASRAPGSSAGVDHASTARVPATHASLTSLCPPGVGRIRARYLVARLPNPPVRPVRETFASYGSRERDIYRKLPFRQLHGIHRGQLARSLATFVP